MSDRILLVTLSGKSIDVNIIQACAPTVESNEDSNNKFYSDLDYTLTMCRNSEINIILGEFNAKVGYQQDGYRVGKYGLGELNKRQYSILVEWAKKQDIIV